MIDKNKRNISEGVESNNPSNLDELKDTLKVIIITGLLAWVLTTYGVGFAHVPTGSMENTVKADSHLLVNKGIYIFSEPKRGDIVTFTTDNNNNTMIYLKRIIGLPGEKIEGRDGYVYINGEKLTEDYVKEALKDDFGPYVIPENSYFMMGDNRDRSDDSRVNVGFVPVENLVGKARFLFFSHNVDEAWYKPWTWPKKIRWSRLFDKIK